MQTYSRYETRLQADVLRAGDPFNLLGGESLGTVAAALLPVHGIPVGPGGDLLVLVAEQKVRRDDLLLPATERQHLPRLLRRQTVHHHLIPRVRTLRN